MKKFFSGLKAFLLRGNVMDMAVGVVVGAAFGKIVSSLVADIITPLISLCTGGANFSELFIILNPAKFAPTEAFATLDAIKTRADAQALGLATLNWGNFVQTIIDFLIIGICIFTVLNIIMKAKERLEARKKKEEVPAAPAAPAEPSTDEKMLAALTDIQALLEKKQ